MTTGITKRILAINSTPNGQAPNSASWNLFLGWVGQQGGFELIPVTDTKLIIKGIKNTFIMQSELRNIANNFENPDFIFIEDDAIVNNRRDQVDHTFEYVSKETRCNIYLIADWQDAITILQTALAVSDDAEVTP